MQALSALCLIFLPIQSFAAAPEIGSDPTIIVYPERVELLRTGQVIEVDANTAIPTALEHTSDTEPETILVKAGTYAGFQINNSNPHDTLNATKQNGEPLAVIQPLPNYSYGVLISAVRAPTEQMTFANFKVKDSASVFIQFSQMGGQAYFPGFKFINNQFVSEQTLENISVKSIFRTFGLDDAVFKNNRVIGHIFSPACGLLLSTVQVK